MSIFNRSLGALDGSAGLLSSLAGKPTLIVNVASKCGLTPQYEQLQQLQDQYEDQNFTVLGVPCNQFMGQEPGTPEEIAEFCSLTYDVTFPLSEKVEVNGDAQHALYRELNQAADIADGHTGDIRWNFEKFLVGADGNVVARFGPTVSPDDPEVISRIEGLLAAHPLGQHSVVLRMAGLYGPDRLPNAADLRLGRPLAAPEQGRREAGRLRWVIDCLLYTSPSPRDS